MILLSTTSVAVSKQFVLVRQLQHHAVKFSGASIVARLLVSCRTGSRVGFSSTTAVVYVPIIAASVLPLFREGL